jgi:hypothetical protein
MKLRMIFVVAAISITGLVFPALAVSVQGCSGSRPVEVDASERPDAHTGAASDPPRRGYCSELGLAVVPFHAGPYGAYRGDVAADFAVPTQDGDWRLHDNREGCDSYIFLPDTLSVSGSDPTSLWESDADLAELLGRSPPNVHYFFVSRRRGDRAYATLAGMRERVGRVLGSLEPEKGARWRARVHVVSKPSAELSGWVGEVLTKTFAAGFAIDRQQRLREVGHLADVRRYDRDLASRDMWPWRENLSLAAHEATYMNADADTVARLEHDGAKVVDLFRGEVLKEFQDVEVKMPDALSAFDTVEVEVTLDCPDPRLPERGNCGAWDYIAHLFLHGESSGETDAGSVAPGVDAGGGEAGAQNGGGSPPAPLVELVRFITPYHRGAHWVADASHLLTMIVPGRVHRFRWEFAPPWNPQPTATRIALRFSRRGTGLRPVQSFPLFMGVRRFDSRFNEREPIRIRVPPSARRVELRAILTGGGNDSGTGCAEFCAHEHELVVNGRAKYTRTFPGAGSKEGCVAAVAGGMTPNQSGTWWLGRGGWCPGAPVVPWRVDVTSEIGREGELSVAHVGRLKGRSPPDGKEATIDMSSWVIVYE